MKSTGSFLFISIIIPFTYGFGMNFNQQQPNSFEDTVLYDPCPNYLCPDTLTCVKSAKDCPCPFPKSQMKCKLPNNKYICISKPASHDPKINEIYDDLVEGPKANLPGFRDCGWILKNI